MLPAGKQCRRENKVTQFRLTATVPTKQLEESGGQLTPNTGRYIGKAVSSRRRVAKGSGIVASQIDRLASAFEHANLKAATQTGRRATK